MAAEKQMHIVKLRGRVSPERLAAVCDSLAANRRAVLDLSGAAQVDWMALAMLVSLRRDARRRGGELAVAAKPLVERALRELGVARGLRLFTDVEAACAALSPEHR